MKVIQIYNENNLRNFSYIVYSESNHNAFVIDPFDSEKIVGHIKKLKLNLKGIINTHEHLDHYQGNHALRLQYPCKVYAHFNAKDQIPDVDFFLKGGEKIEISADDYLEVLDTPGHTMAHVCLLGFKSEKSTPWCVFTGDTLFNAGVGNCRNGGDAEVLYQTIAHLLIDQLDSETLIFPGHDYLKNNLNFTLDIDPTNQLALKWLQIALNLEKENTFQITNLETEREINNFLRLDSPQVIDGINRKLGDQKRLNKQIFLSLRSLRDKW